MESVPADSGAQGLVIREEDHGFYAKYQPRSTLGVGLSSIVKRCVCQTTGNEYAVKIIEKNADKNEQVRAEINALTKLSSNPYIINLVDVYETKTYFFLVFELATGGELFDYLTKVICIPENQTREYAFEILSVIAFMHSKNLVHRDLKPENILLNSNNHVKVSDFGFAYELKSDQYLKELCGTPDYMAPEVLKCNMDENHPGYQNKVDMWSFGVVVYLMLVGFSPFWHRRQSIMFVNIMEGKYSMTSPEWEDISDNAKDFISKLLVVDPCLRYSANEAMLHPWIQSVASVRLYRSFLIFFKKQLRGKRIIKFRSVVIAVISLRGMYRIARQKSVTQSIECVLKNPYSNKRIRRAIDNAAFHVYGHWVKRSNLQNQNRTALFETKPRNEHCDVDVCVPQKFYKIRFGFSTPWKKTANK